jgi:hypothetical protein
VESLGSFEIALVRRWPVLGRRVANLKVSLNFTQIIQFNARSISMAGIGSYQKAQRGWRFQRGKISKFVELGNLMI